jgi:hypothetical protein
MSSRVFSAPGSRLGWIFAFAGLLVAHVGVALVGWHDQGFAGHEFRQAQTAISTYFIQREHNYQLAYPTPILGKPWSIPMEFPLYEWTVARLATHFHWPLVETGRGVSLVCFYLTLPAWFLLLGTAGLTVPRRLAVLMVALVFPVYMLYSRAFLIEAMALLAASWHAWCVVETMRRQRWPWLAGAWITGITAALVKVTTWSSVLVPFALYGCWLLWSLRPCADRNWQPVVRLCLWSAAALLPPLLAGWWWVRAADAIKAQNPAATFLESGPMMAFNFGTLAQRFSIPFWKQLFIHWTTLLLPTLPLLLTLAAGAWPRGPARSPLLLCLGGFLGSQLLFANLYFLHSYYFYANGFLLAGAVGLAACQVLDRTSWPAWLRVGGFAALLAAGALAYDRDFLPRQRFITPAATGLSQAIQTLTAPGEVIVGFGQDWSAIIPFTARRRALMVPTGTEYEVAHWEQSLRLLADETVPLALVEGPPPPLDGPVRHRLDQLHMHPQPLFSYQGNLHVYVRTDRLHAALLALRGGSYSQVEIPRNAPSPAGAQTFDPHRDQAAFIMMSPFPVRYHSPYEVPPWFEYENTPVFIAHPPTELEFEVPAGARSLTLAFGMITEAYTQHGSDGVDLIVELREAGGSVHELWHRRLNPRDEPGDRPRQTATITLPALRTGRLVLRSGPGPAGNRDYDWVYFSAVVLH